MKKKAIILGISGIFIFATVSAIHATLITIDNNTLYDDVNKKYWFNDLSKFVGISVEDQLLAISDMNDVNSQNYIAAPVNASWEMATEEMVNSLLDYYQYKEMNNYLPYSQITENFITSGETGFYPVGDPTNPSYFENLVYWLGNYFCYDIGGYDNLGLIFSADNYIQWKGQNAGFEPTGFVVPVGAWITAEIVPEPETFLLFGGSLILLIRLRRNKKKK